MRISRCNELFGAHHQKGISALDLPHGLFYSLLNGMSLDTLSGDEIGYSLGVYSGLKNGTPVLKLTPDLIGIGKITVVSYGKSTLYITHNKRL